MFALECTFLLLLDQEACRLMSGIFVFVGFLPFLMHCIAFLRVLVVIGDLFACLFRFLAPWVSCIRALAPCIGALAPCRLVLFALLAPALADRLTLHTTAFAVAGRDVVALPDVVVFIEVLADFAVVFGFGGVATLASTSPSGASSAFAAAAFASVITFASLAPLSAGRLAFFDDFVLVVIGVVVVVVA